MAKKIELGWRLLKKIINPHCYTTDTFESQKGVRWQRYVGRVKQDKGVLLILLNEEYRYNKDRTCFCFPVDNKVNLEKINNMPENAIASDYFILTTYLALNKPYLRLRNRGKVFNLSTGIYLDNYDLKVAKNRILKELI